MQERVTVRRNPWVYVYFSAWLVLLWFDLFLGYDLSENVLLLTLSIGVGLILLSVPLSNLTTRIVVETDHFQYKTLLSRKTIAFNDIQAISLVSKRYKDEMEETSPSKMIRFQLINHPDVHIPAALIANKKNGSIFIQQIIQGNPSVKLDESMTKMSQGEKITAFEVANIIIMVIAHAMLLFAFNLIP